MSDLDGYLTRRAVRRLRQSVEDLITRVQSMSAELDRLRAEVANNTTVTQSAVVLLNGLADQIEALKDDPAALAALADEVRASTTGLAQAVTDNTPPAPPGPTP